MSITRLEKLVASLRTSDLDAVALNPGPTLTYLTGAHFHLMERPIVLLVVREADYPDASDVLGSLRLRKDKEEVDTLRKAVRVAQAALEGTLPHIKIGITEKELAAELVTQLLKHWSEPELPFSPIVSGGPNSASAHASTTNRKLQSGDLLVIDYGATVDGYVSDITRTFAVGDVDAEYEKIHKIVQQANAAGRAAGKPGVPCAEVDKAARVVIESAGYGEYFWHRTGHGIGMEPHEEPYIRGDDSLKN